MFGADTSFGDALVERFSLTGAGASAVRQLFASPDQVRGGISALGIVILAYAVLSMAQALQRIYEDAWGLTRIRARGTFRALIWMFTFALYFAAISPLRAHLRQADSRALRIYLPLVLGSVIWAVTPYILLGGRVPEPAAVGDRHSHGGGADRVLGGCHGSTCRPSCPPTPAATG